MSRCPACRSEDVEVFCTLRDLPVHGTVVCETPDQARALARADQVLAVCRACAFVHNTTFDARLLDYSGQHEESQAGSATFRAFATGLAQDWVERYDLTGELVLEVGCGKGDFLQMLADAGVGRAHGVDPGLDVARLPRTAAVTGERTVFAPSETSRAAAAIVCRHTLEHVPDVRDFLETIMAGVDPDRCRALLFEVPDVTRVLDEVAFWDLQYEHCSWFTPTSLRALFTSVGLDVVDTRLVYGGQYLVLDADPQHGRATRSPPAHVASVDDVVARCHRFAQAVEEQLGDWQEWFAARRSEGAEVAIWGGGAKGSVFLSALPESGVRRVVDINPGLQGRYIGGAGLPIVAPEALREDPPAQVLLMNGIYLAEVRRSLDELGLADVQLRAV